MKSIMRNKNTVYVAFFIVLFWVFLFVTSETILSQESDPEKKESSQSELPNVLENVGYSPLKGGRVLIKANFTRPIREDPEVEENADPPQIHLIFDNTEYEAGEEMYHVNIGVLRGVKIVKLEGVKVKISFYLNNPGSYELRVQNNQLIAVLKHSRVSDDTAQVKKGEKKKAVKTKKKKLKEKMAKLRKEVTPEKPSAKRPAENIEWGDIAGQELVMFKGDIRIFYGGPVSQVAVGDSSIISTSVLESGELLMIGEKDGSTVVHIWHEDGTERDMEIHVTKKDKDNVYGLVSEMLKETEGVSIRRIGKLVVIDGVLTKSAKARVDIVAKLFPDLVNLTTEGKVTKEKMIYINLQIVEFNKKAIESLGVKWAEQIDGFHGALAGDVVTNNLFRPSPNASFFGSTTLPPRIDPFRAYLGIGTSIQSKINLSVKDGDAFILASPRLSTRSGGEATFLAGGEIPLPTVDQNGQASVTFKEYGIQMTINPVADDSGYILTKVSTEISDVDNSVMVQGIPGFITRKAEAEINVNDGETMVISGLMNTQMGKSYEKVPFLAEIPILGWLFKSKDFNDRRTELVIFVTPKIVDPNSQVIKDEMEKVKKIKDDFNQRVDEGIVY